MSKVTVAHVSNIGGNPTSAATTLNENADTLAAAFDNTLSRDGTSPNQMEATLDMNSQRIINLPKPISGSEPMRFSDAAPASFVYSPLPVGGARGQALLKLSGTDYDVQWSNNALPVGGTVGQTLVKNSNTDYDVRWSTNNTLPTGGTAGQFLQKNSSTDFDTAWATFPAPAAIGALNVLLYGAHADGSNPTPTRTAIQNAINDAATVGGGYVYFPPGQFKIDTLLTVPAGVTLVGAGMNTTAIFTGGADIPVVQFTGGSGAYNGARDICFQGGLSTTDTQYVVFVDNNTPTILTNLHIFGGYRALHTHGVDGRYRHIYAHCSATTTGSANLFSQGGNFYTDCKFDNDIGSDFSALIYNPYASSANVMENQFSQCDFAGTYNSAAVAIDDGVNPTRVAVSKFVGCVGIDFIINAALWTLFSGCELGGSATTFNSNGGNLTIGDSWSSAAFTVSGTAVGVQKHINNCVNIS